VTVHTAYDVRRTEIVVPVGLDVDLDDAIEVFRGAVLSAEDVLEEPPPDILPWEFRENNVDIRVRWWIKSQRSYEVRSRAAVVRAIKLASEDAGIALPADTKISFAETPLIVAQAKDQTAKEKKHSRPAGKRLEHKIAAPAGAPDVARDPEGEKPKLGELSEGADAVPR
jgi:small-conductance mechanosensitive channel